MIRGSGTPGVGSAQEAELSRARSTTRVVCLICVDDTVGRCLRILTAGAVICIYSACRECTCRLMDGT